jgi:hypothetical protein
MVFRSVILRGMDDDDQDHDQEPEDALLAAIDSDPGLTSALEGIVAGVRARNEFLALVDEIERLRGRPPTEPPDAQEQGTE